jgi:hypothetical protein
MGWIRQSAVREGIRREQVAKFIIPSWLWNSEDRNECEANR